VNIDNPLRDFWLAQVESRILAGRSIYQYYYGINDVHAWMVASGSKLEGGAKWLYHEWSELENSWRVDGYRLKLRCKDYSKVRTGQGAKDAHLDELKRGLKAYPSSCAR
jgi:hypothetical protein